MFKKSNVIENIRDPFISDNNIYFADGNQWLYIYNQIEKEKKIVLNTNHAIIGTNNSGLFVGSGKEIYVIEEGIKVKSYPLPFDGRKQTKLLTDNFIIIRHEIGISSWELCKYDFIRGEIKWRAENNSYHLCVGNNDILAATVNNSKSIIDCTCLLNGANKWHYNTNGLNIHGFPALASNCVCVCVRDEKACFIIGLDVNTGRKIWQHQTYPYMQVSNNTVYTFRLTITSMAFSMTLIEIQENGAIKENDISDELNKHAITIDGRVGYCIAERTMYMSWYYQKKVIILNLDSYKIEEVINVDTKASWINEPQVSGNKLFVLDQGNTLHIYERE